MAINKTPVPDARLNMKIRAHFPNDLAETANVSASARAAGVASSAVYWHVRKLNLQAPGGGPQYQISTIMATF
jgi:hypothetical protein